MEAELITKFYEGFGVSLSPSGSQYKSDCPFCDSNKFFVNKENGLYDCKKCGASGNEHTFMTELHNALLDSTDDSAIRSIIKIRRNSVSKVSVRKSNLAFDGNYIYLPVKTPGNKFLSNLRRYSVSNKVFYSAAGHCSLYFEKWNKKGSVFICEGEWDAISLHELFRRAKVTDPYSIVAVPGANTFKESWKEHFRNRDVYLLYDHDHDKKQKNSKKTFNPGKDGMKRATEIIGGTAKSIHHINWNTLFPNQEIKDGFDITDLLTLAKKKKACTVFQKRLMKSMDKQDPVKKETSVRRIQPLVRTSFDQVVADFRERLEFNKSFEDVLACCFAALITLYMSHQKRSPIWLFIVAPPSTGKTTIIEAFDAVERYTKQVSELTPASLVTGLRGDDGDDPSLLGQLRDTVLFNEDFTPILNMGPGRDEIFGILRAAYNGSYTARFAKTTREYKDLYFGLVSGVTHAIERFEMGELGERFLRIRLIDDQFDEEAHIQKALHNVSNLDENGKENKEIFQASVLGFVNHMMENLYQPDYQSMIDLKLSALAQFASLCRTVVPRSPRGSDLLYRPSPEVGSRIATQLKKLGLGIAVVYGKKRVDSECYRIMQKVAFDSCVGWKLEVIQNLDRYDTGLSAVSLADLMQVHVNHVKNILSDCQQLGMVEAKRLRTGAAIRGTSGRKFFLSERIKKLMEQAGISFKDRQAEKLKSSSRKAKRNRGKATQD